MLSMGKVLQYVYNIMTNFTYKLSFFLKSCQYCLECCHIL
jgi:hypothetical protein